MFGALLRQNPLVNPPILAVAGRVLLTEQEAREAIVAAAKLSVDAIFSKQGVSQIRRRTSFRKKQHLRQVSETTRKQRPTGDGRVLPFSARRRGGTVRQSS